MSKSVRFEQGARGIRMVLVTRDVYDRIRSERTFTVDDWSLRQALKEAGLYERVEVLVDPTPPTTPAEAAQLANEIAWYDTIKDLRGGTPDAQAMRGKLWGRIAKKLGLS